MLYTEDYHVAFLRSEHFPVISNVKKMFSARFGVQASRHHHAQSLLEPSNPFQHSNLFQCAAPVTKPVRDWLTITDIRTKRARVMKIRATAPELLQWQYHPIATRWAGHSPANRRRGKYKCRQDLPSHPLEKVLLLKVLLPASDLIRDKCTRTATFPFWTRLPVLVLFLFVVFLVFFFSFNRLLDVCVF